jgi:Integrase core domain.
VQKFIALVKNWWNLPIKAFHYDNETSAGAAVEAYLANCGIVVSHSIPGHPEQNGPAERSGGVILEMARRLRIEGGLPKQLWPEFVGATAWILNRTPTHLKEENRWIVPWEEARREFAGDRMKKTSLANLRLYGSLSYCRIRSIPRKEKTHPRAEIGFLIGYIASNVWKIWFPARGKVEVVRDAFFDESRKWKPDMQY